MRYETNVPFRGDTDKAMKLAADAITASNLKIESFGGNQVRFGGGRLCNNHENPLRGISTGEITIAGGNISFKGELGAVQKFFKFMALFLAGMALVLVLLFGFVLRDRVGTHAAYIAPTPFAPWIVILPIIMRKMRRQTQRAIDNLLNNMAQVAK